jgi:pectin methylesterase-like acyl-CoA thioesterase
MLLGLGGQAFATNRAVGLCSAPGTHYTTIGAAVTAATSGDTIRVCPGPYPEQVTINKSLTLLGIASGTSDAAVVVVPAGGLVQNGLDIFSQPVAAQIFVQNAAVTISHLTVDGSGNGLSGCGVDPIGIYYQNSSGTITSEISLWPRIFRVVRWA